MLLISSRPQCVKCNDIDGMLSSTIDIRPHGNEADKYHVFHAEMNIAISLFDMKPK